MTHPVQVTSRPKGEMIQAGFTMIEVLVAMTLFMLGVVSLIGLQVSCIRGNAAARMQTEAVTIGTQIIERLRMLPEDHPDRDPDNNPHELKGTGRTPFTVRWMIEDSVAPPKTQSVRVTVAPMNHVTGKPIRIGTILTRE